MTDALLYAARLRPSTRFRFEMRFETEHAQFASHPRLFEAAERRQRFVYQMVDQHAAGREL